ncbi:MAG: PH domain-containing protein [Candidatus Nomurabacteria bacterium]|jgi:hypothetical protein|nr:PH domain-containing protein [Candidatus Nomurabacteria bacterium]
MNEDDQIVAYDAEGKPLYHRNGDPKARVKNENGQKVKADVALVKLKHDRSLKEYPCSKLDDDEYIMISVTRHVVGLFLIWFVVGALVVALIVSIIVLLFGDGMLKLAIADDATSYIVIAVMAVLALAFVSGYIASNLYLSNHFLVTNKKVEQHIVRGLFDQTVQTINLVMIEDISYTQSNFFEHILDYGEIRLSTIGDETTYHFSFVANPDEQVKAITKIVEGVRKKNMPNNVSGPGATINADSSL